MRTGIIHSSAALCLAVTSAGCAVIRGQPGVVVASDPPGATILVDGADSGFVTPAAISLSRADWHRLDVLLRGYDTETRIVGPGIKAEGIPWTSGFITPQSWWFPLWLDVPELLVPLRIDDNLSPSRIFVQLELSQAE